MPNHLTRHLSPAAQQLAERLAKEGPITKLALTSQEFDAAFELARAGLVDDSRTWVALTLAGAEAHR